MAQFIQYLYEYEKGKRVRNLGFMKVDQQIDKIVIQIYAKQLDEVKGIQFQREDGSKYFAAWEDDEPEEIQNTVQEEPETIETHVSLEEPVDTTDEIAEVDEYIPPASVKYEKIQRQDLSRLPRKEWRIANNSFLLHGFYNYHHLLYIEDGEQTWIGVPGIFHEKEKAAANAFGFPKFQRLTDIEVELSEEEKNTYEDFGYWCRQVNVSSV